MRVRNKALLKNFKATVRDSTTLEGIALDFYCKTICKGAKRHLLGVNIISGYLEKSVFISRTASCRFDMRSRYG